MVTSSHPSQIDPTCWSGAHHPAAKEQSGSKYRKKIAVNNGKIDVTTAWGTAWTPSNPSKVRSGLGWLPKKCHGWSSVSHNISFITARIYSLNLRFWARNTNNGPSKKNTRCHTAPSNNEPQVLELGCISLLSLQVSALRTFQNHLVFQGLPAQSEPWPSELSPWKRPFWALEQPSFFHQMPVLEVSHPKDAAAWRQSVNLQCCPGYDSLPTRPTLGAKCREAQTLKHLWGQTHTHTHKNWCFCDFLGVYHPLSWVTD